MHEFGAGVCTRSVHFAIGQILLQLLVPQSDLLSANEALVLSAVTIRDKFGHFNATSPQKPAEEKKADAPSGKYLHGARS